MAVEVRPGRKYHKVPTEFDAVDPSDEFFDPEMTEDLARLRGQVSDEDEVSSSGRPLGPSYKNQRKAAWKWGNRG